MLVVDKVETVEGLTGQFPLLRSMWLDQLLQMLNYRIGEFTPDELVEAPPGTTALKLFETSRSPKGEIKEELRRVLVISTVSAELRDNSPGSAPSSRRTAVHTTRVRTRSATAGGGQGTELGTAHQESRRNHGWSSVGPWQ